MIHFARVRWRWFRLEFNRRAHDRAYWEEPSDKIILSTAPTFAGPGSPVLYAHPATLATLRAKLDHEPGESSLFAAFGRSLYGIELREAPWMVERKWKWVRR